MDTLPIIILDRDGVINEDSAHYIKSTNEFVMLPGSAQAIAHLFQAGFRIGVATNQSGLARGLYDEATLEAIHAKMKASVVTAGGRIEEIIYCPHHPQEACDCRKPKPGLLLALAQRFNCLPEQMIFVGDKITDIQAAQAAGCSARLVLSPMTDKAALAAYPDIPVYASLDECAQDLLAQWKDV